MSSVLSIMFVPRSSALGDAAVAVIVMIALAITLPRPATLFRVGAVGGSLFVALVALTGTASILSGTDLKLAICSSARIAFRCAATFLVTRVIVIGLRPSEYHDAISAVPLPRTAWLILVQTVHQTGLLVDESHRIAQAIRVRGSNSLLNLQIVHAFPRRWLERTVSRAHRLSDAMEMREYLTVQRSTFPRPSHWRAADFRLMFAIAASLGVMAFASSHS